MAKEKEKVDEVKLPVEEEGEKPPEGYTAEEWNDLSDTEKEGVLIGIKEPDEEEPEEIDDDTLKAIAGEEEKPPEEKPPKEKLAEEKKPVEGKPPEEKPPEEKPPEEKPPEEKPPEEKVEAPVRTSDEELLGFRAFVADSEVTVNESVSDEVQKKLDDLTTKFDAGDIERAQYERERDALNRQIMYDTERDRERAKGDKVWEKETRHFLDNRPEYLGDLGEDGKFHTNARSRSLYGALAETIKAIGADPKYASGTGMQLLIAADKEVRQAFGIVEKPKEKGKEVVKEKVKEEGKPPAPLPDHQTLSDVPNAAPNTTEGAWGQLDKLRGEDYEEALERLTPKQREAYLDNLRR